MRHIASGREHVFRFYTGAAAPCSPLGHTRTPRQILKIGQGSAEPLWGRTLCARLQKCINLPEIWKNGGFDRRGCRDSCLPPRGAGCSLMHSNPEGPDVRCIAHHPPTAITFAIRIRPAENETSRPFHYTKSRRGEQVPSATFVSNWKVISPEPSGFQRAWS